MVRWVTAIGVLVLGLLALAAAWFLGMRRKDSVVVSAQRRINRAVFNPRQLRTAGREGSGASVIRHRGRTSGRDYQTPVGAEPTEDGFVVALVYGPRSDWLRNVLANGSALVVHDGVTWPVERPEVVPFESVAHFFPDARAIRAFGVADALLLHKQASADVADRSPGGSSGTGEV